MGISLYNINNYNIHHLYIYKFGALCDEYQHLDAIPL